MEGIRRSCWLTFALLTRAANMLNYHTIQEMTSQEIDGSLIGVIKKVEDVRRREERFGHFNGTAPAVVSCLRK